MAEDGSWSSIREHGLLSTKALLERWESPEPAKARALTAVRDGSIPIEHPKYGIAVVRDQKPLHRASLEDALTDLTVEEWLDELNSRVFFFVQERSLLGLLNSPSYRSRPHTVLTIDTASFLAVHAAEVELTRMNTGFARPHNKQPRGRATFVPLAEFDHPPRAVARVGSSRDVAELCVRGQVADIADHVIRVERRQRDKVIRQIE